MCLLFEWPLKTGFTVRVQLSSGVRNLMSQQDGSLEHQKHYAIGSGNARKMDTLDL